MKYARLEPALRLERRRGSPGGDGVTVAPEPWRWPDDDLARGHSKVWSDLTAGGSSFFHMPDVTDPSLSPDAIVERVVGKKPTRIAVTPIKARPLEELNAIHRRTYPNTTGDACFHIDPDPCGVLPPHLQIMICRRQAAEGGQSLILDVWPLLAQLEANDPGLFRQLFETPRRLPFPGCDAFGPTVSYRHGGLVVLLGATPRKDDVGRRLQELVNAATPREFLAQAGDVYVNDNHRTLHARRAFRDTSRELLRILAWFDDPMPAPKPWLDHGRRVADWLAAELEKEPLWVRQAFCIGSMPQGRMGPDLTLLQRMAWSPAVPPGTPLERIQAYLDEVLARLSSVRPNRLPWECER